MDANSQDDERLAQALTARGLLSRDEQHLARSPDGDPKKLLQRLTAAGFITARQAARLEPEIPSLVRQPIPGYEIVERLGHGTMAMVFKARQTSMNRFVAIKVLHPRWIGNQEYLGRFRREAQSAARVHSAHVVQAIDVGAAGDLNYIVLEYVEGTTVRERLDAGRRFAPAEALGIVRQVAKALEEIDRQRLVHRDVKPANVILTADGVCKLTDLGMVRETADADQKQHEKGKSIGTPYYMAPEQGRGHDDVDIRADLYALGATWYHMVVGRPPFPHASVEAAIRAHRTEELVPPHVADPRIPEAHSAVIQTLLAKDPAERYQRPAALTADLDALERGETPKTGSARRWLEQFARLRPDPGFLDAPVRRIWLVAALWLLALSVVVNVVLFLASTGRGAVK